MNPDPMNYWVESGKFPVSSNLDIDPPLTASALNAYGRRQMIVGQVKVVSIQSSLGSKLSTLNQARDSNVISVTSVGTDRRGYARFLVFQKNL